jgi:hypothetical protein
MRNSIVLTICLLLFACSQEKQVVIPNNVLGKEQMAAVLTEIHLLEASMNLNISNAVTTGAPPDLEATTLEVFKKKGITKEQYDTSFIFYTRNPQLLSEIYQLVLNNLSQLQAEVANQKDTSEPKKDSLQKP